jgi:peptide/nickel transport system substrate-binding protein
MPTNRPRPISCRSSRPRAIPPNSLASRSGAPWTETAFANAGSDRLLDQATSTADPTTRSAIMAQLQTILRDEGVILQPYWRSVYRSLHPRVRGLGAHQAHRQFLDRVWIAS